MMEGKTKKASVKMSSIEMERVISTEEELLLNGRCQYKTGKCMRPRARKKNGQLLRICEMHRKHQNDVKRRSDQKHRKMKKLNNVHQGQSPPMKPENESGMSSIHSNVFTDLEEVVEPMLMTSLVNNTNQALPSSSVHMERIPDISTASNGDHTYSQQSIQQQATLERRVGTFEAHHQVDTTKFAPLAFDYQRCLMERRGNISLENSSSWSNRRDLREDTDLLNYFLH